MHELMRDVTYLLRNWSECEAVGIRLKEGEDFPYFETRGFPSEFLEAENELCLVDEAGEIVRNPAGSPVLECMCGNVIRGRTDPEKPFFTEYGSFWTNSTTELLASSSEEDRQARTRNTCNGESYESVALIPLKRGAHTLGLLQFNSEERGVFTPQKIALLERLAGSLAIGLDHRKTAQKLRERESELEAIIENAPFVIMVVDENNRLCRVNGYGRIVANRSLKQLIGLPIGEAMGCVQAAGESQQCGRGPVCGRCPIRNAIVDTIESGKRHDGVEAELEFQRTRGSQKRVLLCHTSPMNVQNDERVLVVLKDITERKLRERELRETRQELRQTQEQLIDQERQRALSTMASGIAHDFNNVLTSILGFTEVMLDKARHPKYTDEEREYLELIKTSAYDAADSVRRMLEFYRPKADEDYTPLDINEVVEESISLTRPRWKQQAEAAGNHIRIGTDLNPVPPVAANESELHELFTNLIFNCVDAIEGKGTILLRTHFAGGDVVVEVQDTGHGMDAETLEHCLDPFYSTKGELGTGLGLSTAEGILRRHGGSIDVMSEKGEGTVVRITLPACEAATDSQVPDETDSHVRDLRVLLIEDHDTQRQTLEKLLEQLGHRPDSKSDGFEGLRAFHAGWYDLVIVNRAMPELRGDEVARRIKEETPEKPVMMLTGFGDLMDAQDENPEGVDLVVAKPVDIHGLSEAIKRVYVGMTDD
jgi:signal transduction histidine kinase/ActR/RegA family two-component response regulator